MAGSTSGRGRTGRLIPALAVTGVLTYFLDPEKGERRRADASQRVLALLGRSKETVTEAVAEGQAQLTAATESASPAPTPSKGMATSSNVDDVTLTQKVEQELFGHSDLGKGDVKVNSEYGRVVLRGEVPDAATGAKLAAQAEGVPGVREVENLLHSPNEPAPHSTPPDPEEVKARARERSALSGEGSTDTGSS